MTKKFSISFIDHFRKCFDNNNPPPKKRKGHIRIHIQVKIKWKKHSNYLYITAHIGNNLLLLKTRFFTLTVYRNILGKADMV